MTSKPEAPRRWLPLLTAVFFSSIVIFVEDPTSTLICSFRLWAYVEVYIRRSALVMLRAMPRCMWADLRKVLIDRGRGVTRRADMRRWTCRTHDISEAILRYCLHGVRPDRYWCEMYPQVKSPCTALHARTKCLESRRDPFMLQPCDAVASDWL
jgi:hypothetical protein